MRNPSLHIGKSDFILVLAKIGVEDPDELADQIYNAAVPYHIKNRYLVTGDTKLQRKVTRIIENANVAEISVEAFNGLLDSLRIETGARFIQKLNKGSKEWILLREILTEATSFVTTFGFDPVIEGYKTFLRLGIKIMGKNYGLNKFKYYASQIHKQHEAAVVLEMDSTPDDTVKFWEQWKRSMQSHAGVELNIVIPEKMVHMIYGKQEADEANAKYADWVEAQFEGLAFLNAVPELSQFYGSNAKNRYERYMINKGGVSRKDKEIKEEVYNLPTNMSQEQAEYFKALRERSAK